MKGDGGKIGSKRGNADAGNLPAIDLTFNININSM